jgi:hypothetical protein
MYAHVHNTVTDWGRKPSGLSQHGAKGELASPVVFYNAVPKGNSPA